MSDKHHTDRTATSEALKASMERQCVACRLRAAERCFPRSQFRTAAVGHTAGEWPSEATVVRTAPLRLMTRTSGPPPRMVPATFRFDADPWISAPTSVAEPEPLVACRLNGVAGSSAISTAPDPVETSHPNAGRP